MCFSSPCIIKDFFLKKETSYLTGWLFSLEYICFINRIVLWHFLLYHAIWFSQCRIVQSVDFLSIYSKMYYFEIYLELFKLEILSRDLTHVFTLTNKNKRRTKLNENKNKLLDRREKREYSENYFLYNSTCLQSVLSLSSLLFLHSTTPQFIVLGVINAPAILYNQSNHNYHNYTVALNA
jgi:hypothetical protein